MTLVLEETPKKRIPKRIPKPFVPVKKEEPKETTFHYYFAYGSNMSEPRLSSRIGKVEIEGTYLLEGYRLVFNAGAEFLGPFANLIKTGNSRDLVEGVIYKLTTKQLRNLDGFEGAPFTYNRVIERYRSKPLIIYISINQSYRTTGRISDEYYGHLIHGCRENNFTDTLSKIEYHMRNNKPKPVMTDEELEKYFKKMFK